MLGSFGNKEFNALEQLNSNRDDEIYLGPAEDGDDLISFGLNLDYNN